MTQIPRTRFDQITAHLRPQPAIPAVAVLMLSVAFAASSTSASTFVPWLIGAGILASCSLAVAAGFCSFFPQLAWIVLALLFLNARGEWAHAAPVRVAFFAGLVMAAAMVAVQAWRVRTGRFVPTFEDDEDAATS